MCYLSLSFCPPPFSVCLSVCLYVCLSVCLSLYISLCVALSLSPSLLTNLSIYLSVHPFICLSIYLSIFLSIHLSVSVYLSSFSMSLCFFLSLLSASAPGLHSDVYSLDSHHQNGHFEVKYNLNLVFFFIKCSCHWCKSPIIDLQYFRQMQYCLLERTKKYVYVCCRCCSVNL